MPLFEYRCQTCTKDVELLIRSDEQPVCPDCGSQDLDKLLSTGRGSVFKRRDPAAGGRVPAERCAALQPALLPTVSRTHEIEPVSEATLPTALELLYQSLPAEERRSRWLTSATSSRAAKFPASTFLSPGMDRNSTPWFWPCRISRARPSCFRR